MNFRADSGKAAVHSNTKICVAKLRFHSLSLRISIQTKIFLYKGVLLKKKKKRNRKKEFLFQVNVSLLSS